MFQGLIVLLALTAPDPASTAAVAGHFDQQAPAPAVSGSAGQQPPDSGPKAEPDTDRRPYAQLGAHKIYFGVDMTVAAVYDGSLQESMGRERQIKVAIANLSAYGDVNDHVSFRVTANPAGDERVPRPYRPSPDERRTYFFPNQPEGRGVASDPSGLYKVDDYKQSGLDPILQQGTLRLAYVDLHTRSRRYGVIVGRAYVPQGLPFEELPWFTAKDMTHIQQINAQADNGATLYYDSAPLRVDLAVISGNANPYHDYGYFDFTDPTEDKNSAVGAVLTGRARLSRKVTIGGTYRRNYLNSRIEDSTSIQLSKHNDDALVLFVDARPLAPLRLFGEFARYKWGLATTSAELLPGPKVVTPVFKDGYYVGVEATSPKTRFGQWGAVLTYEDLSRDDALVSWAAANGLFGVKMGARERSTIVKVQATFWTMVTAYFFVNSLSNPFPELSAIKPIAGPDADRLVSNRKIGGGIRFRV